MSTTETVTFNVGGQTYQVSKSLLAQFPNTMIAKSASKEWKNDASKEIFIERDCTLFQYVLSYLRDRKVHLPWTVSKKALLEELVYYGVENVNEKTIIHSRAQGVLAANAINDGILYLQKVAEEARVVSANSEAAFVGSSVAAILIENHIRRGASGTKYQYKVQSKDNNQTFYVEDLGPKLGQLRSNKRSFDICNVHLNKAGLKMIDVKYSFDKSYSMYLYTVSLKVIKVAK